VSRVLLATLLVLALPACRSLTRLELDHLAQGEVEAALAAGLRPHHVRAGRPWPAELHDPQGLANAELHAAFFESIRDFLSSPRLQGTTTPEPRQTLMMALRAAGIPDDAPWQALEGSARRAQVMDELARMGAVVDYFARATLTRASGRHRLRLELRDAATWEAIDELEISSGPGATH
jgi:hypothetical protein